MIHKIKIKNFKGIRDLEIEAGETLVLFGENDSGKSTILQAIAVWSEVATTWVRGVRSGEGSELDLARDSENYYQTVNLIKTDFRAVPLYGLDHLWRERVVEKPAYIRFGNTEWSIGFELIFVENELVKARPTMETSEADIERYASNPMPLVFISPFSGLVESESNLDRSAVPVQLSRGNVGAVLRNVIYRVSNDDRSWGVLQDRIKRFYGCELLAPSPSDVISVFYRDCHRRVLYELNSAGSGFLQILSIYAAALFLGSSVILIDEPDAHLHPRRQQELLPDLRRTFPDAQLICSTHSPQMLTTVNPRQIVGVERNNDGISLYNLPPSVPSYGAESGDVLASVMGVSERPEDNEFVTKLKRYIGLVGNDQGESEDAKAIRQELEELSPHDPALDRVDIEIRRRRLMKEMGNS